ncbi:MAG: ligase-associated DNA damage response DEXH box helicase [Phycisphaerales bacterium]
MRGPPPNPHLAPAADWFASRGWTPFQFQLDAWSAYLEGRDGLIHAPTGTGKTLAAFLGPLLAAIRARDAAPTGPRHLWITPLRALAGDTLNALRKATSGLGLRSWAVEARTGDTSAYRKQRQRSRLPSVLVTTPESLALLLSYPECAQALRDLRAVVVDEWHELLGSKRGVQTELGLAALRSLNPTLRTWGVSATLGNLEQAMGVLLGATREPHRPPPALVSADLGKQIDLEILLPDDIERFPWAGHLGIRLLPEVARRIRSARTSLVFTNTRSQSEIWFRSLQRYDPDLIGHLGIHHGSIDRAIRDRVEEHLRAGSLRAVVCTSSLDLGVDFRPVDQVIQIGSPKGVGRLLQRAGRSGHQPGAPSRVVCVPTNAMEIIEFAAVQDAIASRQVESREPLMLSLDVLVQHVVGRAVGSGDNGVALADLLAEARSTHAFATLTDQQWAWCIDYLTRGGPALRAYPQFERLAEIPDPAGGPARLRPASPAVARAHRLGIGTIVAEPAMTVRCGRSAGGEGRALGTIEEGFIARLRVGDTFAFAGRLLRLTRVRGMTAYTIPAQRLSGRVPSWNGSRMPLSAQVTGALRLRLDHAASDRFEGPAMRAVAPLLRVQAQWSVISRPGDLLIELCDTPDGRHAFIFPIEGRLVHEGLAALASHRFARLSPRTITMACNDYGFELASSDPWPEDAAAWRAAFSAERLHEDLLDCLNAAELARRQFREIARVSGLMAPTYPGQPRRGSHAQASSEMFFDVLAEFDADNLLLEQARREVMARQLEFERLRDAAARARGANIRVIRTDRLTPLAFPLWADRLREQLTSEKWSDRVQRMVAVLENAADERPSPPVRPGRGRSARRVASGGRHA